MVWITWRQQEYKKTFKISYLPDLYPISLADEVLIQHVNCLMCACSQNWLLLSLVLSARGKHCHQAFCICITFHSVTDLLTQRHKSFLRGWETVWVNWRKSAWFWLMEKIVFAMFGCGFQSFISESTVSAYLARAWQPLTDEVLSFWEVISPK